MGVVVFAVLALIGFRLWSRQRETNLALEKLAERVSALEYARTTGPAAHRERSTVGEVARVAPPPPPTPEPVAAPIARDAARSRVMSPEQTPATASPREKSRPERLEAITPPAAVRPATTPGAREALESRIGSRWLLYVGVVAIVVGVSYFEKLAIANHWVSETWRVIQGGIAGLVLVGAGLRIAKRGYRRYGQILSGTGVAILYVATYAAFNFYHLIGHPAAFALMSAVTLLGAWLADSQRSQGLAVVAVTGGFATPFLLPSAADAEAALFAYDSLLIAGTMLLVRRREWPALNIVSYASTALTFVSWALVFYAAAKYVTTEIFLTVFGALFIFAWHSSYRSRHPLAKLERAVLWTALPAYYVLSVANLFDHSAALLVYLVMLAMAGVITGSRTNGWVRLLFWLAAAVPLLIWSDLHGGRSWLVAGLSAWTGVYVLNLAGLFEATTGKDSRVQDADVALLHLNALTAFLGAYLLLKPVHLSWCAPLAAALAALNLGFGALTNRRQREQALHFVALTSTLLTIAVALRFEGAWITTSWAAEAVVVTWLGLRERRGWLRTGGLALFALAIARLIVSQVAPPSVGETVLLNSRALSGLFVTTLTYGLAWLHHRSGQHRRDAAVGAFLVLGKLLMLAVVASEIVAYWQRHVPPPFEPAAQVIVASLLAGAAIVWLGLKQRQEWVRAIGAGVIALAAFELFSLQLQHAPLLYVTILNGRAAAGVVAVLALYGLVVLHRRLGSHISEMPTNVAVLTTSASLLTLSLITSEIDAFWAVRGAANQWSVAREGLRAVAWAGTGGFLIWYGLSSRRVWSRTIGAVLLVVGLYQLLWLHLTSPQPGHVILLNARMLASVVVIALLYGLAQLYARDTDVEEHAFAPATALRLMANVLTLTLLTGEITAYWRVFDARQISRSASADMHFAREMMLSITWAVYATILIIVGLFRKYAPIRYFAMTVFAVTIVKVFAIDLSELDRIYRVLSIVGLGVTLLLTSYLYQKLNDSERA